jgi:hypothetical protein
MSRIPALFQLRTLLDFPRPRGHLDACDDSWVNGCPLGGRLHQVRQPLRDDPVAVLGGVLVAHGCSCRRVSQSGRTGEPAPADPSQRARCSECLPGRRRSRRPIRRAIITIADPATSPSRQRCCPRARRRAVNISNAPAPTKRAPSPIVPAPTAAPVEARPAALEGVVGSWA